MSIGPACLYCARRPGRMVPVYIRTVGRETKSKRYRVAGHACEICARGAVTQHKDTPHGPIWSSSKTATDPTEVPASPRQSAPEAQAI